MVIQHSQHASASAVADAVQVTNSIANGLVRSFTQFLKDNGNVNFDPTLLNSS